MSSSVYKETNASPIWYMQIWGLFMSMGLGIKNILLQIPEFIFPDNPARSRFFPFLNSFKWENFMKIFNMVLSLVSVATTWDAVKKFYDDKEKTKAKWFDITIKVLTTILSCVFFGLVIFGGIALVLKVAPYILAVAIGLNAIYCLYNVFRHLYLAYKAYKASDRIAFKNHLWDAGKYLLAGLVSGLGLALSIYLGIKMDMILSTIGNDVWQALIILMTKVSPLFSAIIPIFYAFCGVAAFASLASIFKPAWELSDKIVSNKLGQDFIGEVKSFWEDVKAKPYFAPLYLVKEVLDLASFLIKLPFALLMVPAQLIAKRKELHKVSVSDSKDKTEVEHQVKTPRQEDVTLKEPVLREKEVAPLQAPATVAPNLAFHKAAAPVQNEEPAPAAKTFTI